MTTKFSFNATRHQRHLLLPSFSGFAMENIAKTAVCVVGIGGLGSNTALQLAAAGIGKLTLVDYDIVDESNLPRQLAYGEADIGKQKTAILKNRIKAINGEVQVECINENFTKKNTDMLKNNQVVIDGLDSIAGKLSLANAALQHRLPLVHAGVVAMNGQVTTIVPGKTACLNCAFPSLQEEELTCASVGVYAPLCQFLSSLQASETLLCAMGKEPILSGKIYFVVAPTFQVKVLTLPKTQCLHSKN